MGAAQSLVECCTNRDKMELQLTDPGQLEKDAKRAKLHAEAKLYAEAHLEQRLQQQQQQQQPTSVAATELAAFSPANRRALATSWNVESKASASHASPLLPSEQGTPPELLTGCGTRYFPTPQEYAAKLETFAQAQARVLDSFGQRIGASLTPGSLYTPTTFTTQVDTPKIQEFRLTQADTPDNIPEVCGAGSLQVLPETPRWIADNGVPPATCMNSLLGNSTADPPRPPRPGFRATAMDKEEQAKAVEVLTASSKGVPDPPLALPADAALATKEAAAEAAQLAEAFDFSVLEATQAADYTEEGGWSRQGSFQASLRNTGSCQEKRQWSVNSEDSLVAKLAERMQRQRGGRMPDDQQLQQYRRSAEPQLEAKLADRMEQQLCKERTGVASAALQRQKTWACDGGGIGFIDKTLERRLEQQRLKAEGMRPQ